MPRMRGTVDEPEGEAAWPLLNAALFGDNRTGGHHVVPAPEVLPVRWSEVFGRDAPRTLEIGFNRGRFLRAIAEAWPEHDHVGVEIRRRYCWRLANIVGPAGRPPNLRLVWADARLVAPAIFGEAQLHHIFINFPDPWWKRRHAKRRLVTTDFAAEMRALLRVGGRIHVKSDVPAIASEIADALGTVEDLEGPTPFGADDLPPSYREHRCMQQGLPITRFWFERA